jgi:hypothetical protein
MIMCRAMVPNQWYHFREYPGTKEHPCPFKARKDGWCNRHHPSVTVPVLNKKVERLKKQLAIAESELADLPPIPDGPEIHCPS